MSEHLPTILAQSQENFRKTEEEARKAAEEAEKKKKVNEEAERGRKAMEDKRAVEAQERKRKVEQDRKNAEDAKRLRIEEAGRRRNAELEEEFLKLQHNDMTVPKYTAKFNEKASFAKYQVATTEEREIKRYIWGLRAGIKGPVQQARPSTFQEAVELALMVEKENIRQLEGGDNKKESRDNDMKKIKISGEKTEKASKCKNLDIRLLIVDCPERPQDLHEKTGDLVIVTNWLKEIEDIFEISECSTRQRVKYASHLLKGEAQHWWDMIKIARGDDVASVMTWEEFEEEKWKEKVRVVLSKTKGELGNEIKRIMSEHLPTILAQSQENFRKTEEEARKAAEEVEKKKKVNEEAERGRKKMEDKRAVEAQERKRKAEQDRKNAEDAKRLRIEEAGRRRNAEARETDEIEDIFEISECSTRQRVKYASHLLKGEARHWWDMIKIARGDDVASVMTWEEFEELVMENYCP
nr:zinc finger, CCHC-type, retrotransposon Gag domain protein [Tanacetum cinerariifolium]